MDGPNEVLVREVALLKELVAAQQTTIDQLLRRVSALEAPAASGSSQGAPEPVSQSHFTAQPPAQRVDDSTSGFGAPLLDLGTLPIGSSSDDDQARLNDLVVGCALDYLNTQADGAGGIWCEHCDRPCTGTCEESHGQSETLRLDAETVLVEGKSVPLPLICESAAREALRGTTRSGVWCQGCTVGAAACPRLHRADGSPDHVMVEGTPIPVSALQRNRAVELLLTHPLRDGNWCGDDEATHDVTVCYRVHKRSMSPGSECSDPSKDSTTERVLVAGKSVPLSELRRNPAVEYLIRNPSRRGRWCVAPQDHDPDGCNFVHLRTQNAPKPLPAADTPKVNVAGNMVAVTELAPNGAVDYLLEHPSKRGRWCNGHGKKTIQECTFVHTRHEEEVRGADPADAADTTQRTKRMVVYYEADTKQETPDEAMGTAEAGNAVTREAGVTQ